VKNILIIKIAALGDVLRTTCILAGLHEKYPNVKISWLTSASAVCLLEDNPLIEKVIPIETTAVVHLKENSYDLVISLDDEPGACNLASDVKTKKLFGAYRSGEGILYTPDSADWFNMSLISTLGKDEADKQKKANQRSYPDILFDALKIRSGKPSLHLGQDDWAFAKRFRQSCLEHNSIKIGLNTGAGNRWQLKRLGVSKTVDLANELSRSADRQILVFGGPEELVRNQEIIAKASCPIVDTGTNNSIRQLSALVGLCDVLVTSDSLALHIASALGIATVSFFGPTSAAEIKLFTRGEKVESPLSCVCCYKRFCDFSPNCMDVISTDQISQAVEKLLVIRSSQPS